MENTAQLNKDQINKDKSITHSINPAGSGAETESSDIADPIDRIDKIREKIKSNIDYDIVAENNRNDKDRLDEIVEIMTECVSTAKEKLIIGKEELPAQAVKKRFLKLDSEHIEYILLSLKRNTTKIKNIKAYLRTVIYNAPMTISNYYSAEVNHDLYGNSKNIPFNRAVKRVG